MRKRLIFDIDDTLIPWEEIGWEAVGRTFDQLGLSYKEEEVAKVRDVVDHYEEKTAYYTKENFAALLTEVLERPISTSFVETLVEEFPKRITKEAPPEIKALLAELSQKYSLVTLSNWFQKGQEECLKRYGILEYFDACYTTEGILCKPAPEAFALAQGEYAKEECVMIGDSLRNDVLGALAYGMKAVLVSDKASSMDSYPVISSLKELNKGGILHDLI